MQRTLVEEKRWIGQRRFLHALNYCMLLPGPEAQQLAIYVGWLLNGTRGGLVAGTLFVLPGVVALLALADPPLLLDQRALHDRDLPGRPTEGLQRDREPGARRLAERHQIARRRVRCRLSGAADRARNGRRTGHQPGSVAVAVGVDVLRRRRQAGSRPSSSSRR
jgi:hypothetical protein